MISIVQLYETIEVVFISIMTQLNIIWLVIWSEFQWKRMKSLYVAGRFDSIYFHNVGVIIATLTQYKQTHSGTRNYLEHNQAYQQRSGDIFSTNNNKVPLRQDKPKMDFMQMGYAVIANWFSTKKICLIIVLGLWMTFWLLNFGGQYNKYTKPLAICRRHF